MMTDNDPVRSPVDPVVRRWPPTEGEDVDHPTLGRLTFEEWSYMRQTPFGYELDESQGRLDRVREMIKRLNQRRKSPCEVPEDSLG